MFMDKRSTATTQEKGDTLVRHVYFNRVTCSLKTFFLKEHFCTLDSLADDTKLSVRPLALITKYYLASGNEVTRCMSEIIGIF